MLFTRPVKIKLLYNVILISKIDKQTFRTPTVYETARDMKSFIANSRKISFALISQNIRYRE
jgi:hypothetical protein